MTPLKVQDCADPKFNGQETYTKSCHLHFKDEGGSISLLDNILSKEEREEYLKDALRVTRKRGLTCFGSSKPRLEVAYVPDHVKNNLRYSQQDHFTTSYPPHVKKVISILLSRIYDTKTDTLNLQLSHSIDILYDSTSERGGSIAAHADTSHSYELILILSLGQSRYIRFKRKRDLKFFNFKLKDNSLLVMVGNGIQKHFTHQIDKLSRNEDIGSRLSLNVRFVAK